MGDYGHIRSSVSDWRSCRSPFDDRSRRGELGCSSWVAASGKHVAGLSRVYRYALHLECACNWGVDRRQAAEDTESKNARAVRCADCAGGVVRSRSRRSKSNSAWWPASRRAGWSSWDVGWLRVPGSPGKSNWWKGSSNRPSRGRDRDRRRYSNRLPICIRAYAITGTSFDSIIRWSEVMRCSRCTRAVATIARSAGSRSLPRGWRVGVDDITHDSSFLGPAVPRRLPGVSLCGTENRHRSPSSGDRDWPAALLDLIEVSEALGFKLGCAHHSFHDVPKDNKRNGHLTI